MKTTIAVAVLAWTPLALAQAPQQPQQPQQPQTPGSSSQQSTTSSTTVVVPPPPGQAPVVVQPQQQPIAVAPCPPPETKIVYRGRRPNPVGTVLLGTFGGGAAGAAIGASVGLMNGDDKRSQWERDIGTGTVVGFVVGATVGGIVAWLDYDRETHVAVAPVIGGRSAGLALAGRF